MSLDQDTIKRIANLARLKIAPEKIPSIQQDLNRILDFINELNEVDTSEVTPMAGGTSLPLPLRQDAVNDGGCASKILANAPEVACNMFVVPKVVD